MKTIKSKCYILFYCKIPPEMACDEYLDVPQVNIIPRITKSISQSSEKETTNEELIFPVKSKTVKVTKPIAVEINDKIGDFEIPLDTSINNDKLNRFHEEGHDHPIRINLHDEFKYLYGYLDINGNQCANFDYLLDEPIYFKQAKKFEKFVSIICNFVYKTAAENGAINANTTAEVLGINICNSINKKVKEIGELILQFFNDCLTKRNNSSEKENFFLKKERPFSEDFYFFSEKNKIFSIQEFFSF